MSLKCARVSEFISENMEIDIHQAQRQKKRKFLTKSQGRFQPPARQLAQSNVQQIKRIVSQSGETKYYDVDLGDSALTSSFATFEYGHTVIMAGAGLFNPALGNTSLTRVGKQVQLMNIRGRTRFRFPAQALTAGGTTASSIRWLLVRDKEPTPAIDLITSDVLQTTTSVTYAHLALQNINNFGRFEVLMDKTIVLQDPNLVTTGVNGREVNMKWNHKFKVPIKVRFNDTLGYAQTDRFSIFAIADSIALAPVYTNYLRFCYKDE